MIYLHSIPTHCTIVCLVLGIEVFLDTNCLVITEPLVYIAVIFFYAPTSIDRGHVVFGMSVCPSVRLSVCFSANTYIGYIFWVVRVRAFIFHECTLWLNLSVGTKFKVISEGQGQISRSQFSKKWPFHKHSLFSYELKKKKKLVFFVYIGEAGRLWHADLMWLAIC